MKIQTLTDLDAPGVQAYRTLRRPVAQYEQGLFIAEGSKVVNRLLGTELRIRSILLTHEWLDTLRAAIETHDPPPIVYTGTKELLQEIVGFNLHQGIMALAEIPPEPDLERIVTAHADPPVVLALDDLTNSENVGVIVRNARAFDVSAIVVGETASSPYLRRAVRNSLGAVFSIPIIHTRSLAQTLRTISNDLGLRVVAAETGQGGVTLESADMTKPLCLVVGGEDRGIRPEIMSVCTAVIEIPMAPGVDSLNVANATAVSLYEIWRQRRRAG